MKVCKKCGEGFKIHVCIDGLDRNLCNRKNCLHCVPFKSKKKVSRNISIAESFEKSFVLESAKKADSKVQFSKELGFKFYNGSVTEIVNYLIEKYNISMSHFDRGNSKRIRYERVEKVCPICDKKFLSKKGSPREKVTCSRACANSWFRSGTHHPNWSGNNYRDICFSYHDKSCIICGENIIVEVHHYDENNKNNSPENLVPLCSTHHRYWHSKHRHLIEKKVEKYVREYLVSSNLAT